MTSSPPASNRARPQVKQLSGSRRHTIISFDGQLCCKVPPELALSGCFPTKTCVLERSPNLVAFHHRSMLSTSLSFSSKFCVY
ncbi:hypothetical protein WAI453_011174 [Rhynchosporium graminicola]